MVVKQKSITNKKLIRGQSSEQSSNVVSKASKKRSIKKSKTTELTAGSANRGNTQQATFEVQSTKLIFMKGHGKESQKMANGIDTKIDWLQMAKDEKTMAGSKLLQEQLSKA